MFYDNYSQLLQSYNNQTGPNPVLIEFLKEITLTLRKLNEVNSEERKISTLLLSIVPQMSVIDPKMIGTCANALNFFENSFHNNSCALGKIDSYLRHAENVYKFSTKKEDSISSEISTKRLSDFEDSHHQEQRSVYFDLEDLPEKVIGKFNY